MNNTEYTQARISKDPHYDGVFFVAVKSTSTFCRSICPALSNQEDDVEYFQTASEALVSGYKPCSRCRPESSPFLPASTGTESLVKQALNRIYESGFIQVKFSDLAKELGITDRYLRKLFEKEVGIGPKAYLQHQQILFAKALLSQSHLSVGDIAYACGFNNVRRFNDAFKRITKKVPSDMKKRVVKEAPIRMLLNYQAPYDWSSWHDFVSLRLISGVETLGKSSYGRTFDWYTPDNKRIKGYFLATHRPDKSGFNISIELSNCQSLYAISQRIRKVLDLNANVSILEQHIIQAGFPERELTHGLRIPGCWSQYEAGVRAILGQQVSVKAANVLVNLLVSELGDKQDVNGEIRTWFPSPEQMMSSDLHFLKIPEARKETLRAFSGFMVKNKRIDPDQLTKIKGIGEWTTNYIKMRADNDTNVWLATDLGIKKAMDIFPDISPDLASPWRSYLTFQLWNRL